MYFLFIYLYKASFLASLVPWLRLMVDAHLNLAFIAPFIAYTCTRGGMKSFVTFMERVGIEK